MNRAGIYVFSFFVSIIIIFPYIYGSSLGGNDLFFLQTPVINSADTSGYLANIESVKQGAVLLPNLYSTESHDPYSFKPTYFLLGTIARVINLDSITLYQAARFAFTFIFILVLWEFLSCFFEKSKDRWIALIVVLTSSGLGFWGFDLLASSIDLWIPEANTFSTLLQAPHFITSQIFLILSFYFLIRHKNWKELVVSSFFVSLLILEHPFMTPFVMIVFPIIIWGTLKQNFKVYLKYIGAFMTLPSLSTLFVYLVFRHSDSAQLINIQNVLLTPDFSYVLLGFGLLVPLALVGVFQKSFKTSRNILIIWAVGTLVLIYVPFSFQRRLLEGVHIPLAILASMGMLSILKVIKNTLLRYVLTLMMVITLLLTNVFIFFDMLDSYSAETPDDHMYFIFTGEKDAMDWLRANSQKNDIILANIFYSNFIPGFTGRYVYNGHKIQTFESDRKTAEIKNWLLSKNEGAQKDFLNSHDIRYIFVAQDDYFRKFIAKFESKKYLEKVYSKNGVDIFRFTD